MDVASIKRRKTRRLYTKGKPPPQFYKFKHSVHDISQSNTCENIINNPETFILTTVVDGVTKTESETCDVITNNDDIPLEPEEHNNLY